MSCTQGEIWDDAHRVPGPLAWGRPTERREAGTTQSRKIQRVGAGTLTLSLPREWVGRRRLQKGDSVFILQEGEQLRIIPATATRSLAPRSLTYVIDADRCDDPGLLERIIVGNYVLGRERIVVHSDRRLRPESVSEAYRARKHLLGLVITEETPNEITLQCALDPAQYPLDRLVRRLEDIGVTMLAESVEALVTRDRGLAEDTASREEDADMVSLLILRHLLSAQTDDSLLAELGLHSRLSLAAYRMVTQELEEIADSGEGLAHAVVAFLDRDVDLDPAFARQLRAYADLAIRSVRESMNSFFGMSLDHVWPVFRRDEELTAREEELVCLKLNAFDDPRDILPLRSILRAIRRIGHFAESIAGAVVNDHLAREEVAETVAGFESIETSNLGPRRVT